MAQVPATDVEYPGNGSQTQFTVPFEFISRAYVFVAVDGVNTPFTWVNDALIEITPAPANLSLVRIYRNTPAFEVFHAFDRGIPFLPRYVDENNTQLLDAVQEAVNDTAGTAANAEALAAEALETANRAEDKVDNAIVLSAEQLRLDLAEDTAPADGARLIGYSGRTQYSRNQDQPHMFDYIPAGQHAAIVAGTSSYDAASDFAAAIAQAGEGGNIWLPQRGTILTGPVTVGVFGIGLRGANSSAGYYSSRIKGITDGAPVFTVTQPQFSMTGVALEGLSNTVEKGENITQNGILLTAPTQNHNLDAVFTDCVFAYFREVLEVRGRNVRIANTLFSNSRRAVLIDNYGLVDVRGLELYDCRFHNMGKVGTGYACIHAEPAANFSEIQVIGGEADDCLGMFTGFASNTTFNIHQAKARGQGYNIDATAATASLSRRVMTLRGSYQGEASAPGAFGAVKAVGAMLLDVDMDVMGCTGHGLEISTPDAKIAGSVADAGQSANNTYDAVLLGASAATSFIGNLKIAQDRYGAKSNKARYGLNNLAADVEFGPVSIQGTFGTAQTSRDTTRFFNGPTPGRSVRQAEVWGTAPPAGAFAQGATCHNTAPTRVKNISHWCVVAGGASPTWMAYGCGYGTTAERPTLGAQDAGYLYRDTTTGTLILWNGSTWA